MKRKKPSVWEEEGRDGYDWYEGQTKWPLRRILGIAVVAISAFIYLFLFYRFFTSFSGGFGDVILLTEKAAAVYPSETASVRRFYPTTAADDDGSVQIIFTAALEETDTFQCTLKINRNAHPPASSGIGWSVFLRWDRDGETRILSPAAFRKKDFFQYRHLICSFEDVPDAEHATLTLLLCPQGTVEEPSFSDAFYTATVGGDSVYSALVHLNDDRFVKNED